MRLYLPALHSVSLGNGVCPCTEGWTGRTGKGGEGLSPSGLVAGRASSGVWPQAQEHQGKKSGSFRCGSARA